MKEMNILPIQNGLLIVMPDTALGKQGWKTDEAEIHCLR
jgi:hypothetical protein